MCKRPAAAAVGGGAERGGLTAGSGSLSLPALEEVEAEEEDSSKLVADDDIVVPIRNAENNDVCNGDGYHFQDCASKCLDSAADVGRECGGQTGRVGGRGRHGGRRPIPVGIAKHRDLEVLPGSVPFCYWRTSDGKPSRRVVTPNGRAARSLPFSDWTNEEVSTPFSTFYPTFRHISSRTRLTTERGIVDSFCIPCFNSGLSHFFIFYG